MKRERVEAWRQARAGGESVAVMANRTATVTHLNHLAQHARITDGELDPHGPTLTVGGGQLHGDSTMVQARSSIPSSAARVTAADLPETPSFR